MYVALSSYDYDMLWGKAASSPSRVLYYWIVVVLLKLHHIF